jgi:hypothetical protein
VVFLPLPFDFLCCGFVSLRKRYPVPPYNANGNRIFFEKKHPEKVYR